MYHFCTYFDAGYLPRGLALHRSLSDHCPAFTLWVLCMDAESHHALTGLALPGLRAISVEELEAANPDLVAAKAGRSRVE